MTFNKQFHGTWSAPIKALEYIDRLKGELPSPAWQHLTFTVAQAPGTGRVWIQVDAATHAAHVFAKEELSPRGFSVPMMYVQKP